MNILLVSNKYPPEVIGGAERVVQRLAHGLRDRGHSVYLFTTRENAHLPAEETVDGIHIYRCDPRSRFLSNQIVSRPRYLARQGWAHLLDLYNPFTAHAFRRVLRKVRPHLIHSHNLYGLSPSLWHAAHQAGYPVVHTSHDSYLLHPTHNLFHGQATRAPFYANWHLRQTRLVHTFCAPSTAHLDVHKKNTLHAQATAVIHPGVSLPEWAHQEHDPSVKRPCRVLYLGRLDRHKGFDTFLKALQRLAPASNLQVDIAGVGPLEKEARKIARQFPALQLHGFVEGDTKEALLKQADLLVFPSLCRESFGLSIIEAFAYGIPALVSDTGGQREWVENGKTGFRFDPGNARSLADRLEQMIRQPERLPDMARNARKTAEQFTEERMLDAYEAVYNSAAIR